MTRLPNHFEKALAEAEKRLARALNERSQAQTVLNDLALEIPSLQETISALQHQLNPRMTKVQANYDEHVRRAETGQSVSDLPFSGVTYADVITEDDLPEPEGTPLLPED